MTARRLGVILSQALRGNPRDAARCDACRHFQQDREQVERQLPGILILSSAFGDSWGDAGICALREEMCLPFHGCRAFSPRPPDGSLRHNLSAQDT